MKEEVGLVKGEMLAWWEEQAEEHQRLLIEDEDYPASVIWMEDLAVISH